MVDILVICNVIKDIFISVVFVIAMVVLVSRGMNAFQ